ncbi:MAG TPA: hypothetical protein EYG03_20505, partial [Planctomycetes bacterium]|nr:hypothetical protein [Planctomycetota bacterium]
MRRFERVGILFRSIVAKQPADDVRKRLPTLLVCLVPSASGDFLDMTEATNSAGDSAADNPYSSPDSGDAAGGAVGGHSNVRIRLNIMMFLEFFIWGAFFVPMGSYLGVIFASYQQQGTLNQIIGSSYATQTWAALFAPLIVGFVADRLFNKEHVNGVLHLVGGAILLWCS